MKAYVLHGIGDLRYEEIETPQCPAGWALVRVRAAGICSSDIPRIFETGTYHFPTIPGHELSGVVSAVGADADAAWVGKHVSVFPLIPCRQCAPCAAGQYEMCEHYDYVGSRRDGGFAELVAVPVWNLVALPDTVGFDVGAMMEPLSVGLHAVNRIGDINGKSVKVIGTGIIGLSAALWAKYKGASEVTVITRNPQKQELIQRCGLNWAGQDSKAEADVVIEAVGTPEAIRQAIACTAPGGRLMLTGNPSQDILLPKDVYWRVLRKQLTLLGTWNSRYNGLDASDWTEVVQALEANAIPAQEMISFRFDQANLPSALTLMREHQQPYCKVITLWNNQEEGNDSR